MSELIPPLKPRRSYGFVSLAVLAVVALVAVGAAWGALIAIERISKSAVDRALFLADEGWAEVETNGLQVILSGAAPSEAARFAALSAAAHEVDGARVIDQMILPDAIALEPPHFSVEMLRNEAGISLIGLIPADIDREALSARMRAIDPIQPVADFLEIAEHPVPEGWNRTFDFVMHVAAMLPRSKISMDAEHVAVEAIAASPDQKAEWEQEIRRRRPAGLRLALDIRAPLDVISPYIVRFLSDEQGARFDACTAYTSADRNRIVAAGIAAGVKGTVDCTIGLGVPSPDWPDAVARGIQAVRDMGGGALTFSDADVTLIAPANTPQDTFDRVTGELEADLPEVFSLHSVLTEPETGPVAEAGPPEFIATLSTSGTVQLRGRVASEQDRTIVESLARARFGTRAVYAPLRLDQGLPASWAVRTLAGLEALDQLADGRVVVRPDVVTVTGTTGDRGASSEISRLLSEKLGEAEDFRVNVKYEEALDPVAAMPTPQECVADVNAVMAKSKISFAPGSAEIERSSAATVDRIAEILKTCPDVAMEIGGYTDSQGREEMNKALSQRRADSVVSALLARRVLTTNLTAFGYGEESPIADNDTEEGREANRRIEFSLVGEAQARTEPEPANGESPTIRPPARPAPGATGEGAGDGTDEDDSGTEPAATTETGADAAATDDAGSEDAAAPAATDAEAEETGTPDGETSGAAEPQAPVEDAAEDTETVAEVATEAAPEDIPGDAPDTAADDPAEMAAVEDGADAEAVADQEADTAAAASGTEAASPTGEVGEEAPSADANEAADVATGSEADQPSDGPGDPETTATAGADAGSSADSAAEAGTEVTAADTPVQAEAQTDAPVDAGAAVDPALTVPDDAGAEPGADAAPATPDETDAEADVPAEVALAEAETDAADADAPVADTPETDTPDADSPDEEPLDPDADMPETDLAAEAMADGADPTGPDAASDPAPAAALDIPAIRPRARPPLVVHPDLAGIRPRPRPAVIPDLPVPDAQSTE